MPVMNTPPQFDSCPSTCSSSIASFSLMPITPETYPEYNPQIVLPLHPPMSPPLFDMDHSDFHSKPRFMIGPDQFDEQLRECHTVPEEDEDDTASEIHEPVTPISDDHHSGVFISPSSDALNVQQIPTIINTPMTPPIVPESAAHESHRGKLRRQSEKIYDFLRRANSAVDRTAFSTSHDSSHDVFHFHHRSEKSKRFFGHLSTSHSHAKPPSSSGSTSSSAGDYEHERPRSVRTFDLKSGSPPKRSAIFSRKHRSNSVSGIKDMTETGITHPAVAGAGSKSRKMSTAVPDVMNVPVIPLSSKYANHSHVPGKSRVIGEGVSAIVKVMHKISGPQNQLYAVKEYRKKSKDESEEDYIEKVNSEYCISKSLCHPNIVATEDLCFSNNGRWCHVMEFCSGGDLYTIVSKGFMKEEEKLCIFKQLVRGVGYLHDHGIAHRDIKPENLLVSSDGHLKITDFGVSEVFNGIHPGLAGVKCGVEMSSIRLSKPGVVGSAPYISPEVQNKTGEYDARKLDVWSCAMVYFVLAFGGPLWHVATNESSQYRKYVDSFEKWLQKNPDGEMTRDGNYPRNNAFQQLKPNVKRLLYRMLHLDPSKRVTIQEVISDRWIQGIECCNVDEHSDPLVQKVDAGCSLACKQAGRVGVHRLHVHLPPATSSH
ncbi:hypothetical protein RUND412_000475 [Rhizina undulata]